MAAPLTSMTFADGNILASRRVPVTTIIINRAEVKNALDVKTARGLAGAFQMADADEEIRAIVVTGAGGCFCAGADLGELAASGIYLPWADGDDGLLATSLSKPVIAAIEGAASAEGLGVALFCDMRIVDETAAFSVASRLWGGPTGDGTTVRLPRLVGVGRALDMVITGRTVTADEALVMGLANRRAPRGFTRAEAEKLAHQIAELPQTSLLADRRSLHEGLDRDGAAAIAHEVALARAAYGPEAQAGVTRHVQRTSGNVRLLRV